MLKRNHRSKLWLYFAGIVFATVSAVFLLVSSTWLALMKFGQLSSDLLDATLPVNPYERHAPLLLFALDSLLLGSIIAIFVGKLIVRPMQRMGDAFDELSRGNFSVSVPEDQRLMEIREMAQRFNAMAYDLSHIETLRSDFVANVSHEFKTPIAAIEGYTTLLQNPHLSRDKQDRYVEKILENARRLSRMSGNILLLSKLENQEILPDQEEFRLDEQIRQCVLMLESKWSPRDLEFDIEMPKLTYYGSRTLLEQVWLNILDNAIKHSPPGSTIRIQLIPSPGSVEIRISDCGDGMTEEVQKHIFEKFYQADPSRTGDGNGLGLALVKRIIDLCHGKIHVNSAPGTGSIFTICLNH